MKSKFKVLAAAVAFAAAGSANAIIQTGATGDGEHVFSVWDTVANVGYVRDLGLLQSAFNPTTQSNQTFAADATLTSFLTGRNQSNLLWNVVASENAGPDRLFTTVSAPPPVSVSNGTIGIAAATMNSWAAQVNTFPTHSTQPNGSAQLAAADGIAFPGSSQWGSSIGGTFLPNAGAVGDQLGFVGYFGVATGTATQIPTQVFSNSFGDSYWTFLTDGTLNFVVAQDLEPIPEPSTWALMIAGLLGLGAVARRRAAK
jgi:hypothetical protein